MNRFSLACLAAFFTLVIVGSGDLMASTTADDLPLRDSADAVSLDSEILAFESSSSSAKNAIAVVEKQLPGSKTFDIGFDGKIDPPVYRIQAYRHRVVWDVVVIASQSEVSSVAEREAQEFKESALQSLLGRGLDLKSAIEIAERQGDGRAISGTVSTAGTKSAYLIVIVAAGKVKLITIEVPGGN